VAEEGFAWLAGGHAGVDETDALGKGEKGQRVTNEGPTARRTSRADVLHENEILLQHPSIAPVGLTARPGAPKKPSGFSRRLQRGGADFSFCCQELFLTLLFPGTFPSYWALLEPS
jgi:hypothetical protein